MNYRGKRAKKKLIGVIFDPILAAILKFVTRQDKPRQYLESTGPIFLRHYCSLIPMVKIIPGAIKSVKVNSKFP